MTLATQQFEVPPMSAGLLRRLGAILSDSLVLFGILALVTLFVFVPVLNVLGKKAMVPSEVGWLLSVMYGLTLMGICFGFYGYFWTRSGQTIGMRAWRLKLVSLEDRLLGWQQAFFRWLCAVAPWVCGLFLLDLAESFGWLFLKLMAYGTVIVGSFDFLSMYTRLDRRCWHDRVSSSKVILLPER